MSILEPGISSCELEYHPLHSNLQDCHLAYHDTQLLDGQLGHKQNIFPVAQVKWLPTESSEVTMRSNISNKGVGTVTSIHKVRK